MPKVAGQPQKGEFECTIFGPGYGEGIVLHVGDGSWVVVDSCQISTGESNALHYLKSIGVDLNHKIALIVATHWHDDHVRGIADLVKLCGNAQFCCSAALCSREFLILMQALEGREDPRDTHGLKQLYGVFSWLKAVGKKPTYAFANRVIFRSNLCTITSLSPGDKKYQKFLESIGRSIPEYGKTKTWIPSSLSPNDVAIALWIECGQCTVLLGSDLERESWVAILDNSVLPKGKASVFKVPHHGSKDANEPEVWNQLIEQKSIAVVAPWRLGGKILPTTSDVHRILEATPNAWITSRLRHQPRSKHKNNTVQKTLRDITAKIRPAVEDYGMVRLRRSIDSIDTWKVEKFGEACHLSDYVV